MNMKMSDRLELVASFARRGSRIADVGTDHGYVPIALAARGIAEAALAMDVKPGPLSRAEENIRRFGLEEKIAVRLSDGVRELRPGEADTVILAGMGGELVIHIIQDGKRLWDDIEHWILSPQSEIDKVRRFLQGNGFRIDEEAMICEDGKYYTVMDVVRGVMEPLDELQALYGPVLLKRKDPCLCRLLERERRVYGQILDGLAGQEGPAVAARREEIERLLSQIEGQHWLE